MALHEAERIPVATYRLQLHREFTFAQVEGILPYLSRAGITDCYLSPILLSAPGSQHGYDVNDFRKIDPELGGAEPFHRLAGAAARQHMGLLVDFVPNHMGISGPFNLWWRDVLECGRHSPYARFFDIYWQDSGTGERSRVLVPVLADHYGKVLEQGGLQLQFRGSEFELNCGEMNFPLSPHTQGRLLRLAADENDGALPGREIRELADTFSSLPHPDAVREPERARARARQVEGLKQHLAGLYTRHPGLRAAIRQCLERVNGRPGDGPSFDLLDDLLENQHYRLARWQAGAQGTNYRRFFAIDSLVGVRMEIPEVFRESHALIGSLIHQGAVAGLRIDHIDGLWDPQEYLERLQDLRPGPVDGARPPLYIAVEKILENGEALPPAWPVHGTTGYEFIFQLAGLFVDRRAESRFTALYASFSGIGDSYENMVYSKKRLVLESLFGGVVSRLTQSLLQVLKPDRAWRDITSYELAMAVRELLATLEVYRTYRRLGQEMSQEDRQAIEAACHRAVRRNPRLAPEPFEFIRDLLTGVYRAATAEEQDEIDRWTLTFQQYSGAVTAKAVEDTAYYTFNRLVALNEVGGDPRIFGGSVEDFHAANRRRLEQSPLGLLATSTHDSKMSEDVRARLYTLSEIPDEWENWVREWRDMNRRHKARLEGGRTAPDDNEEYRLYQVLLGAWPLEEDGLNDAFRDRIRQYQRKAVSEAKENTTWHHPNEAWLEAGDQFVNALLDQGPTGDFLISFRPRAQRLAHLGMVNSLAQVALKITSPGVPDFYQGNEIWNFSLVDPDNRRAVDFETRNALLESAEQASGRDLMRDWRNGAIKLRVTQGLLRFRRAQAALFRSGDYRPVSVRGRFAENVVAFCRVGPEASVLVIVPRLTARLGCPPLGLVWEDTRVAWEGPAGEFEDVLSGRRLDTGPELFLADAFNELPFLVALVSGPPQKNPRPGQPPAT